MSLNGGGGAQTPVRRSRMRIRKPRAAGALGGSSFWGALEVGQNAVAVELAGDGVGGYQPRSWRRLFPCGCRDRIAGGTAWL